ncbi:hypothetical protein Tco_0868017 [Tanacetum coccineum]
MTSDQLRLDVLIVFGTPNLHTTCSHANFSARFSFIMVKGFASTHLVECSMAISRNFKFPGVVGKGPRILIPQWLNGHVLPTVIASLLDTFLIAEYHWHRNLVLSSRHLYASMVNSNLVS